MLEEHAESWWRTTTTAGGVLRRLDDITDPDASVALAQRVVDELGHVDVLAHIAGVVQTARLAERSRRRRVGPGDGR